MEERALPDANRPPTHDPPPLDAGGPGGAVRRKRPKLSRNVSLWAVSGIAARVYNSGSMRFLLTLLLTALPAVAASPNIVFIFIDDMGYGDLSVTGNTEVETQHIDRLAAEGVRFTQFYVGSPICSPSRVAITTGQYPSRWLINSYLNNRRRNRERGMANFLSPQAPAVARAFRQAGYATAHFGKWHMGGGRDVYEAPTPQAYGFDESLVSFEGLGERILPPGGLSEQSERLGKGPAWHVTSTTRRPSTSTARSTSSAATRTSRSTCTCGSTTSTTATCRPKNKPPSTPI